MGEAKQKKEKLELKTADQKRIEIRRTFHVRALKSVVNMVLLIPMMFFVIARESFKKNEWIWEEDLF